MTAFLLTPFMFPFTVALGLFFGLLTLELVAAFLGGTVLGMGSDAEADIDLDADFDADLDLDADFDAEFDIEGVEALESDAIVPEVGGGVLDWLGFGKVPLLIWLGVFLLSFGFGGFVLQSVLNASLGALPSGIAALIVAPAATWFTGRFAHLFARLLPKIESSAVSKNHLGRRRGVVSQGNAARGRPAEVRVSDGHGNTHYIRAEPLRDDAVLPQGTEVLVMRRSHNQGYRLVALTK